MDFERKTFRKDLGVCIVEIYVSEDRTIHFLWIPFWPPFPCGSECVQKYTQIFLSLPVRFQEPKGQSLPPPNPHSSLGGCCGPCHLFLMPHSDSFLWGFGSDGFCWMQGALLGFMGFCSSAFPHLRTPGHAGDSVLQAVLDSHFLNNL